MEVHWGERPALSKGGAGWRLPGRENNKGHQAGRAGHEVGAGERGKVVQAMRHLDFTWRTVTC